MNATRLYKILFGAFLSAYATASVAQGKIVVNDGQMVLQNSVYVVTTDVSVTSAGLMKVDNSTIKIAGNISSSNTIDVQTGTVEMNGSSTQTIPANAFKVNKIKNLIISNDVNLAGEDSLTGVLSFGTVNSKTFITGDYLTLKSTASGTASVADMTNANNNSGNSVTGNVNVERYLSSLKKWRFLSVPTSTAQTIREAWQENCGTGNDCLAGFGTQITGTGGTAAGFDLYSPAPSMKTYNTGTNDFTGVPNTTSALINTLSNNTVSYFVFVRGDRTASNVASPVTATVIRSKGVIKQGDQAVVTIASPATAFTPVGNPYPARIDLRKMTPAPTPSMKIYVWDPLLYGAFGYGAYQTLTFDGSDFTVTPGGGIYGAPINQNPNYIESGNAFFVGGNFVPYDIIFKEEIKPSTGNLLTVPVRLSQAITANLLLEANGQATLIDGIKADIKTSYSNEVDDDDARKMKNSSENVSILRNGLLLSVERYKAVSEQDTFQLHLSNLRIQKYQWEINMQNLPVHGLQAYLVDQFKNNATPLSLNGATNISFAVENIAGSSSAKRFLIVFKQPERRMPFSFVKVDALRKTRGVNIQWSVVNDAAISKYLIERSTGNNQFYTVYQIPNTSWRNNLFEWLDENAAGENYTYRIQGINEKEEIAYSKIAEVNREKNSGANEISIYPNPLMNGVINYRLANQPAGLYRVKVLNALGEEMVLRQINHAGGSANFIIEMKDKLAKGIYQVETITPDNKKHYLTVMN